MNIQYLDIMNSIKEYPFENQRSLAERCGYSLGTVNKALKDLATDGYLDTDMNLTAKAKKLFQDNSPKNAIILAAGFGMRMVPINTETPKALLEVDGEVLIERIIRQLHAVGITDITIVVGFMKERFEYLIDEFGVELSINNNYAAKNNLHSLNLVHAKLSNTYIIPCDVWCRENPFREHELYSWYMVREDKTSESPVRVNRKYELVFTKDTEPGNSIIGISYLCGQDTDIAKEHLAEFDASHHYDHSFWEEALYNKNRLILPARVVSDSFAIEINTYEQLRELDNHSNQLKSNSIDVICEALQVEVSHIHDIEVLKKGMTNRSFLFSCDDKRFIMRIPGEGTDQLINRKHEASVYQTISGKGLCDDVFYINPDNGYKITAYLENARNCDSGNEEDLIICMDKLREFHQMHLIVDHEFDIWGQIDFYESLWNGIPSIYKDYEKTKENIFFLKEYISNQKIDKCLTHIDAVPDNFLIYDGKPFLIDWEYAGMQDPHVDIAMFCIYALYDREQTDHLIDLYFKNNCPHETRIKIYGYIAACGLLWSNWCEYKRNLGVEFGEYSIRQYRYSKEYFKIVQENL